MDGIDSAAGGPERANSRSGQMPSAIWLWSVGKPRSRRRARRLVYKEREKKNKRRSLPGQVQSRKTSDEISDKKSLPVPGWRDRRWRWSWRDASCRGAGRVSAAEMDRRTHSEMEATLATTAPRSDVACSPSAR